MHIGAIPSLVMEAFRKFSEDKVTRLSAALAYYTIFSMAPLLIIVIAIAGAAFGEEAARGQIVAQIRGLVGESGAELIQEMVQNASKPGQGVVATIVGVVTLLIGASGVFSQLQDALNTIWGVMPKPGLGIVHTIKSRFMSFALVFGVGFLLLVALVIDAALSAALGFLADQFPQGGVVLQIVNQVISLGVITALFALLYKYLPDVKIGWRDVLVGAFITALLFTIGKYLIGLYLGNSSPASVYGAAGSLVVLLIWIYYSSVIVFFGAEITQVYAMRYGSHIEPAEDAIPLTPEVRARQGIPLKADVDAAVDVQDARNRRNE